MCVCVCVCVCVCARVRACADVVIVYAPSIVSGMSVFLDLRVCAEVRMERERTSEDWGGGGGRV